MQLFLQQGDAKYAARWPGIPWPGIPRPGIPNQGMRARESEFRKLSLRAKRKKCHQILSRGGATAMHECPEEVDTKYILRENYNFANAFMHTAKFAVG